MYLSNTIIWDTRDTLFASTDFIKEQFGSNLFSFDETIYQDSSNRDKHAEIELLPVPGNILQGEFSERFPISGHSYKIKSYRFEIDKNKIFFDPDGSLNLDNIRRLDF